MKNISRPKRLYIKVTESDIVEGRACSTRTCPVALAVKRLLQEKKLNTYSDRTCVGFDAVSVYFVKDKNIDKTASNTISQYAFSKRGRAFIRAFDAAITSASASARSVETPKPISFYATRRTTLT